jgi:Mg2+ and Co2+ transporter CorA
MSATLLPAKGSPPAADATEVAVRPSVCEVIHDQGSGVVTFDRATVESLLASGRFFWLDLGYPTRDDFDILREVFKFHPLALEDSEQFNQRAKIDGYDDFVFIVIYGAGPDDDRLVEVHCFYSERFLSPFIATTVRPLQRSAESTGSASERSTTHRCCCTELSTASSTAYSRASTS